MNRRWICGDVWMDILPSFDHAQLGHKMALLSYRFDVLVDTHFEGKSELAISRWIKITNNDSGGPKPELSVRIDGKFLGFPLPNHPLSNKIRFQHLHIEYIDHSVIEFLHANKHIWDSKGTKLEFIDTDDGLPIWDVLAHEIWPIFAPSIRCLNFADDCQFDQLCCRISSTILTDLDQLDSINFDLLLLDEIADDGLNGTSVEQVLSEWLHTPPKNGKSKRLFCADFDDEKNVDWLFSFKETFIHATTSASYKICFGLLPKIPIEPFELVNEWTNEKLALSKEENDTFWLLKRCPIVGETATVKSENENWDDKLNNVHFALWADCNCIGPLLPPAEENEEAGKSNGN